jgi:hypothetical protein
MMTPAAFRMIRLAGPFLTYATETYAHPKEAIVGTARLGGHASFRVSAAA